MTKLQRSLGALTILILYFLLQFWPVSRAFNLRGLDIFRASYSPHPDIVILAIDNKSLTEIGRWPWSREVHARLFNELKHYDPALVGVDVVFAEQESTEKDALLAQAIGKLDKTVILASEAVFTRESSSPRSITLPLDELREVKNIGLGHVNIDVQSDGISRIFPHFIKIGKDESTPFSFAIAKFLNAALPKNQKLVNFAGPAGAFSTFSYTDVLNGRVPKQAMAGKVILVGATASDLHDTVLTPTKSPVMAGVEWHANVIDNIALDRAINVSNRLIEFGLGIVVFLLLGLAMAKLSNKFVNTSFLVAAIGLPIISFAFWRSGHALPFVLNTALVGFLFVVNTAYHWYIAEAEKRKLRQSFAHYFSPQVLETIVRDPESLKLGGQRREVSILFSDIRSFTTITESLPPQRLTTLLQEYFDEMTQEVFATDGVVDKFIGDAILAFWGAPIDQPDHADRAVKTAIGMINRLKKLQKKWQKENYPFVDIGVGINTGTVTVGNMGSTERFDYTVIGDDVNAASRLEGLNKEYKTNIIISQSTKSKLTKDIKSKPLGNVIVKGKTKKIKIYQVIA